MNHDQIASFFARHERICFQFSAGKDSAAVLWLLESYWSQMDVVWMNPGDCYPETYTYMQRMAKMLPRFRSVLGAQHEDIKLHGHPVDIVPLSMTAKGRSITSRPGLLVRPYTECCWNNMWKPMQDFVMRGGYSGVIRGQKLYDRMKNPLPSGVIVNDVEYFYPIDDWTDQRVFDFLGEDRVPPSYKRGLKSSLDCMSCTAYTHENPGRLADLRGISTTAWKTVTTVHLALLDALAEESEAIRNCHGE